MKDIAAQLVDRANPTYVKQKAKEAAVQETIEIKDRIVGSPVALGIIGGLATAFIAKMVIGRRRRAESRSSSEMLTEPIEPGDLDVATGVVAGKLADVKHAAAGLKDRAVRGARNLGEHLPSADEVKAKAHRVRVRATDYTTREPLVTALGALAIGATLGFVIPLTDSERRVLGSARDQVSDKAHALASDVADKVQEKVDELHDQILGDPSRGNGASA